MSTQWVCDTYEVPAKRGRYVEMWTKYDGKWVVRISGHITSACQYIRVRGHYHDKDCNKGPENSGIRLHPTWNVVYYDEEGGEILKDCRC